MQRRRPSSRTVESRMVLGAALLFVITAVASAGAAQTLTEQVPMRDSVELATDVFLPDGEPPFPVLAYRTPYDRTAPQMQEMAETLATNVGVAVVLQDVRGRFGSEGIDCVFRCELGEGLGDGADTFAWIDAQDWSDGVAMSAGGSALGIVQYMQSPTDPPGLSAMFVEVGTPSFYSHGLYQGGVLRKSMIETWLESLGGTSAQFIDEVRAHPLEDAFWDPVQTRDVLHQVDAAGLHVGGWFDIFSQGTIDAFVGYQHEGGPGARGRQKLVMGPWTHGTLYTAGPHGELTFPEDAVGPHGDKDYWIPWVLHHLGVAPNPATIEAMPAVQYYVMGDVDDPDAPGREWRSADDWPIEAGAVRWYLQPEGRLAERCPPADGGSTSYRYDPEDPSPTVGGANLVLPAGPMDQREVEAREDNIVFETPVFEEPMEVTGRVRAHLFLRMDVVDTDVMVRLTDVYPDGRSMLLLDGAARVAMRHGTDHLDPVAPGELVEVEVDLWSTSNVFAAGHRLRIAVTGSNAPRFQPSPNDGTSYGQPSEPVVATVRVLHDAHGPSYLELPQPARAGETPLVCDPAPYEPDGEGDVADGGADADAGSDDAEIDGVGDPDAGVSPEAPAASGGGGCSARTTSESTTGPVWMALLALVLMRRRRAHTGTATPSSRHRPFQGTQGSAVPSSVSPSQSSSTPL
ncbi:MAG: CocE/NonD family hydrolase [Myxococcota bacterium]